MQNNLISINDLRWFRDNVRIEEQIAYQFVLAGMLNEQLKVTPMSMNHIERGVDYTYPIVRFEVFADKRTGSGRDKEFTHHMVVPVIDQPDFKYEGVPIRHDDANVLTIMRNIGYVEPPKPEEPPVEDGKSPGEWRRSEQRLGMGGWPRVEWCKDSWKEVAYHQVATLRMWGEAFMTTVPALQRLAQGELVVWRHELQPERWPQVPMFRVVAQVAPFINPDTRGGHYGSGGLVDTILIPNGYERGTSPFYAKSDDIYTMHQYEALLLTERNRNDAMFRRDQGEFKPGSFIVDVIKKIPDEFREGLRR